eukprot:2349741-Pyramimonas_sp.AAC.1
MFGPDHGLGEHHPLELVQLEARRRLLPPEPPPPARSAIYPQAIYLHVGLDTDMMRGWQKTGER